MNVNVRLPTITSLALVFSCGVSPAAFAQAAPLHLQDRAFMLYALENDLAQVQLGALAAEKASDPEVRRFAADVLEEHRQSTERLTAEARRHEVGAPTEPNPVAKRTLARLQGLAGGAFDRGYLAAQVIWNYGAQYGARREMRHGFDPELRREGARQAEAMGANRRAAERLARGLGPAPASRPHPEDSSFLLYAMHVDMAQRGFAEMAAERARDDRARAFARELVDYHSRSYDRFARLATARGVEPLRELSAISKRTRDGMGGLDGLKLDWTFLNAQAFTSYGAHYRYEREAIHGRDLELREVAAAEAQTSREQHQRALDIMGDWNWSAPAS